MFKLKNNKDTLEGILEVFTSTKQRLKDFIDDSKIKETVLEFDILELNAERQEVLVKIDKAERVLSKINELVGE